MPLFPLSRNVTYVIVENACESLVVLQTVYISNEANKEATAGRALWVISSKSPSVRIDASTTLFGMGNATR